MVSPRFRSWHGIPLPHDAEICPHQLHHDTDIALEIVSYLPSTPTSFHEYAMFKSIGKSLTDLSSDLRERQDWEVGTLSTLDHLLNVTALAFDPVLSILAVGE